jgi:hypothetical protein
MDDLSRDLTSLYTARIDVPSDIDEAVRARIRERAALRRRGRSAWRDARPWLAAACLVVVAGAAFVFLRGAPRGGPPETVRAADVDASGRIDILDAFALARMIERGAIGAQPAHDVNGDGAVDRADVDAIAMEAVSLAPHARELSPRAREEGKS